MTTFAETRSTQLYCGAQGLSNFEIASVSTYIQRSVQRHWAAPTGSPELLD